MAWNSYGYDYGFRPYVSVAQRKANAAKEVARLAKKGRVISPVKIDGQKIARTFWGKAWCENLENYSDYSNRLPRGRTYVRNGSVVDLQIERGKVTALVSGSELYEVDITFHCCAEPQWKTIRSRCAGQIGSLIELLQGKLSAGVMEIITGADSGLFPKPREIKLGCSCPDGASMCKHVAAVLYGVGARLDQQPELLFALRQVDHLELIAQAGDVDALMTGNAGSDRKTLDAGDLADVFGIDLEPAAQPPAAQDAPTASPTKAKRRPTPTKQPARKIGAPEKPRVAEKPPVANKPMAAPRKTSPRKRSPPAVRKVSTK